MKEKLSQKYFRQCAAAALIAVVSALILARVMPDSWIVTHTVELLNRTSERVMKFSGATISASLGLSALPDDFASPMAETLSNMNMYFIIIQAALYFEKILVSNGMSAVFCYMIPAACILYILSVVFDKDALKWFAYKILLFALTLAMVIPCSTLLSDKIGKDYFDIVDQTISETENGADVVNNEIEDESGDETLLDKLNGIFSDAVQGVSGYLEYFKSIVEKCIKSLAILFLSAVVSPLVTFWVVRWLFNELFHLGFPSVYVNVPQIGEKSHGTERKPEDEE